MLYCFKNDKLINNVTEKVNTPKLHTKAITRLEVDEVAKLINEAESPEHMTKMQQASNIHQSTASQQANLPQR